MKNSPRMKNDTFSSVSKIKTTDFGVSHEIKFLHIPRDILQPLGTPQGHKTLFDSQNTKFQFSAPLMDQFRLQYFDHFWRWRLYCLHRCYQFSIEIPSSKLEFNPLKS